MVRIIALACVGKILKILSRICSGPHEVLSTFSVMTRL